jgi:hypothetical protein
MAIDAIIANASAKVAGATPRRGALDGTRFDDLLIAAPGNHPVSARTASDLGTRRSNAPANPSLICNLFADRARGA